MAKTKSVAKQGKRTTKAAKADPQLARLADGLAKMRRAIAEQPKMTDAEVRALRAFHREVAKLVRSYQDELLQAQRKS